MPQNKYPLLDILTSSVFEIVCCFIKKLKLQKDCWGIKGKEEKKKGWGGGREGQQIPSEELDSNS